MDGGFQFANETQDEAERATESIRAAVQNAIAVEMDRG
jgi:hypothetical protein